MAYTRSRRTTLKRRATYGRGTRRYRQTVYRRAYFNRRRGVGRKEKKGADVPFTTETVLSSTNTNGGIYLLNGIQEGVGSWNRIGRYMWNKSIELDLTLRYTSSYGALDTDITSGEWVRAVLVWDKQPNNGAIPTFDTIFGQTSQAGVESASVMDHLRYDNMFRFKVLMDECINPTSQMPPCQHRSTPQRQAWSTILTSDSTNMSSFETCSPTSVELQTP